MAHTTTLAEIITAAIELFAPADAPTRYFSAALKHAGMWRAELVPVSAREIRTAYLQVGPELDVELPDDYMEWQALGLTLPGWGGTRNLIYNGHIPLVRLPADIAYAPTPVAFVPPELAPGPAPAPADYLEPLTDAEVATARYGSIDADYDGYCGYGQPCFGGDFRIDTVGQRIVFSSRVPENAVLVLEYFSFAAPDEQDIVVDALAKNWGVNAIVSMLHAQKKDWNSQQHYEKEALRHKKEYRRLTRNMTPEAVRQAQHEAAAQNWK